MAPFLPGLERIGFGSRGRTALIVLRRVGAGGHNNTEINPVFRGMVRPHKGGLLNQRKTCD